MLGELSRIFTTIDVGLKAGFNSKAHWKTVSILWEASMLLKISRLAGIILILSLVLFSSPLKAGEENGPVYQSGLYIGVQANYLSISGDQFDADTAQMALWTTYETMWVPKLDNTIGFGATFGFREGGFGMELGFITSSFDGIIYDETYDTSLKLIDVNLKLWLSETSQIQPFLLIGGELCFMTATDAAELNYSPYTVGDTKLTGMSAVLGGGISYYILPEIAFNLGVNCHLMLFNNVSGPLENSYELEEDISATLLDVNLGLTVTLN